MSALTRRPPAREIVWPRLAGPSDIQHYAGVDQAKSYRGASAGSVDVRQVIRFFWQDLLQINPVREQPRLLLSSAAQPIVRTGHNRRFSRTYMSASPRFFGRWAFVGTVQRQYTERTRISGFPMRTGTTYTYPRFKVSPRTIALSGAGGGKPANR